MLTLHLVDINYFDQSGKQIQGDLYINKDKICIGKDYLFKADEKVDKINLKDCYLIPGFVDLQVNGGKTPDTYFTKNISSKCLEKLCHDHLKKGTTSLLPTLVTTSFDNILEAIDVVKDYQKKNNSVLGMHLEGPYINPEKKGAHNPSYIKKPTNGDLKILLEKGVGVIKMITVAPELFTKRQLESIRECGIIISAGHSNTDGKTIREAIKHGVSAVTHLYNSMSGFTPREEGLVGSTLDTDLYAGIIADGFHCNETALRLAWRLKRERLFLVSDATLIGKESFEMEKLLFTYKEGRYVNKDGMLAGSAVCMYDTFRFCAQKLRLPIHDIIKMTSSIPIELLNSANQEDQIVPQSDFIILKKDDLTIQAVIKNGQPLIQNKL